MIKHIYDINSTDRFQEWQVCFHMTKIKEFQLAMVFPREYTLSELSWGKWIAMSIIQITKLQAVIQGHRFNTLRLRQNGSHFADDTFKSIFVNENVRILIKFSLKFVPKGPINNIPVLVQIMAWRWWGDKPLSESMMVRLLMHIYSSLGLNELAIIWHDMFVLQNEFLFPHMIRLTHLPPSAALGSGNGLLPDSTIPLPQPMLILHKWGPEAFLWEQFYRKYSLHKLLT